MHISDYSGPVKWHNRRTDFKLTWFMTVEEEDEAPPFSAGNADDVEAPP